jgi:hypothetical protein
MDNLYKDINRLTLITDWAIGQERFSLGTKIKDFTTYYFTRFVTNLTHVFADFSSSEIADYNNRHSAKLKVLSNRSVEPLKDLIVPIPHGMISSYSQTLNSLTQCLTDLHPEQLEVELNQCLILPTEETSSTVYTKSSFEQAKKQIGKLFAQTGLSHSTVDVVLGSVSTILTTNNHLVHLTQKYYPLAIALNTKLNHIEQDHAKQSWSNEEREIISQQLMTLAYRLSIFAVVVKHLQEIEHGFVKSLQLLLDKTT